MGKLVIGKKTYYLDVDKYNIESIVFFGSKFTGLDDNKSDVDLLLIIDNVTPKERKSLIASVSNDLKIPEHWISAYTRDTFHKRFKNGDYFIWCLKLESKILYSRSGYIEKCFINLKEPVQLSDDLQNSHEMLKTSLKGYNMGNGKPEELMNIIAHQVRDTCIRICYMHGVIIFDKVQPIKYCLNYNDIDIPFTLNDYEELLEKKRNYKHDKYSNVFEGNPNKYLDVWYRRADELFVNAISYARTYDRDNFRDPLRFFRPYRIPFHCRYYD